MFKFFNRNCKIIGNVFAPNAKTLTTYKTSFISLIFNWESFCKEKQNYIAPDCFFLVDKIRIT